MPQESQTAAKSRYKIQVTFLIIGHPIQISDPLIECAKKRLRDDNTKYDPPGTVANMGSTPNFPSTDTLSLQSFSLSKLSWFGLLERAELLCVCVWSFPYTHLVLFLHLQDHLEVGEFRGRSRVGNRGRPALGQTWLSSLCQPWDFEDQLSVLGESCWYVGTWCHALHYASGKVIRSKVKIILEFWICKAALTTLKFSSVEAGVEANFLILRFFFQSALSAWLCLFCAL